MKTKHILAATLMAMAYATNAQVVINIDAAQRGPEISPTHYGIFYEDINHAADGGLYAELVRNRSFEDDATAPQAWHSVGGARLALTTDGLLNHVQHHALSVTIAAPGDGVRNEGFWGMNAVKGREYKLSLCSKSDAGNNGPLTARLQ